MFHISSASSWISPAAWPTHWAATQPPISFQSRPSTGRIFPRSSANTPTSESVNRHVEDLQGRFSQPLEGRHRAAHSINLGLSQNARHTNGNAKRALLNHNPMGLKIAVQLERHQRVGREADTARCFHRLFDPLSTKPNSENSTGRRCSMN